MLQALEGGKDEGEVGGRGGHKCHLKKSKMLVNSNPKPRALSTWVKERGRDMHQE